MAKETAKGTTKGTAKETTKETVKESMQDRGGGSGPEPPEMAPPPPPASPPPSSNANNGRPPLSPVPRLSGSPPPAAVKKQPGHNRGVSTISDVSFDASPGPWDSKAVANTLEQAANDESKRSVLQRHLTIADVTSASPIEAEAETLLLQSLEEKEKVEEQNPDIILPHINTEDLAAFEAAPVVDPIASSGQQSFQEAADTVRASATGTKGKLKGLNHAMMLMHQETHHGGNVDGHPENQLDSTLMNEPVEQDIPKSDADTFLNNANLLFRRTGDKRTDEAAAKMTSSNVETSSNANMDEEYGVNSLVSESPHHPHSRKSVLKRAVKDKGEGVKREMHNFYDFIEPRKATVFSYSKWMMLVFILPLTIIGIIMFYAANNPMFRDTGASMSWLMLFLVRNLITMSLAKGLEVYTIFYLGLRNRVLVRVFGPVAALIIILSRGYPCILIYYGVLSVFMLCGYGRFAKHWLYYQSKIELCNAANPAGTISESRIYAGILGCCILFGVCVTLKRHWLGLRLGRRAYNSFGERLAKVMDKMLLVSEVAKLSLRRSLEVFEDSPEVQLDASFDTRDSPKQPSQAANVPTSMFYKSLNNSQRNAIMMQLEAWEEPVIMKNKKKMDQASLAAILQFKTAVSLVDSNFPFSVAFGPAGNREACIDSSQKVYERLLIRQDEGTVLHFSTIAEIAMNKDGTVNKPKLKELVRLFRPSRDGELTMIDFVKSVDSVYKEYRLVQASIENSGSVDRASELLVNWIFFVILWCVMFMIVGLDPFSLFVSISSFFVGFSFMIGASSAKYFDGLLFILVRKPYDIGDRISVSDPEKDTCLNGSTTWFVEDLGLYSTTVRLAATNEVATYSNGSLADSRIINAARSPQAVVAVLCKFAVNTSYAKIQLFKKAVEKFVKERPREWLSLVGFRATRVELDLGFIEYIVVLQHRESWQNIGAILNSKAEVTSFTLELSKQLGIKYNAPPLPVSLSMNQDAGTVVTPRDVEDPNALGELFRETSVGVSDVDGDDT